MANHGAGRRIVATTASHKTNPGTRSVNLPANSSAAGGDVVPRSATGPVHPTGNKLQISVSQRFSRWNRQVDLGERLLVQNNLHRLRNVEADHLAQNGARIPNKFSQKAGSAAIRSAMIASTSARVEAAIGAPTRCNLSEIDVPLLACLHRTFPVSAGKSDEGASHSGDSLMKSVSA